LPLKRALNIPLLVHFRGTDATEREEHSRYSSLNHWLYFNRQRDLKIETNLFLTVSSFIRDRLLEQGFPPEKVIVHYHGVDTSTFAPDRSVSRKPLVLFVGRLAEKKGCEYLIRAMAQVQSVLPEAELIIIGDGPLRYQLESQAAKQLQRYHFLGFQPPEVVRSWMNRARLLAAPSITGAWGESEGLPNVVMEAQAMALPVVGTHHAGIPEAVMHRETGFLVAERDIEGLVESMLLLLKNTDLWQNFSQRGRASMLSTFNRSRQSQVLEEIYEAVLRRNL
jgi:glycosyltransferase involved in cell wall biosynthesis